MGSRARILDLSFSQLRRDARVLRQLSIVAGYGAVTTLGYGPATPYSDEHLEIPAGAPSLPQTPAGVANLALHRHRAADLQAPGVRAALSALRGRSFDAVVANDARSLPLALAVADGAPVWADLHEWAPEERTQVRSWRLLVAPWIDHVCRDGLPRVAASTTVGARIAELYAERYGIRPRVMRNAAPFADLSPSPVAPDGPIRLAHSGGAVPGRALETIIDATLAAGGRFTLDLYLVPAGDGGRYLRALRRRAAGSPAITFHDPVPPADLPAALNAYDVGVYWIPPYSTNARLALPNKLFDFVQARLALAVGPAVEMAEVVDAHGLGVVSSGFELPQIVESLRTLTPERVATFKAASHAAARGLSFESEARVARDILEGPLGLGPEHGTDGQEARA
jgi:glycosyltransferase involved in cell wall biosynthesis